MQLELTANKTNNEPPDDETKLYLEAAAIAMQKLMPVVLLFLLSLPTFAQRAEIFGGYQLTHFDGGPNSNGWNAAVTGNFLPFLGVTADFSGVYNSGTHFYTYTFGPRYMPALWA